MKTKILFQLYLFLKSAFNYEIPFKKLSKDLKRMVIIDDTIRLIKSKVLRPKSGVVFRHFDLDLERAESGQLQPILQKLLYEENQICEVCERGALLCSVVLRDNAFTICDLKSPQGSFSEAGGIDFRKKYEPGQSTVDKRLSDIFEPIQIAMMETAFERQYNSDYLGYDTYLKCIKFGDQFVASNLDRSLAIFENALTNGGIFKP